MKNRYLLLLGIILPLICNAQQWENIGFDKEIMSAFAIHPDEPNILYLGTTSNFSLNTYGSLFRSFDSGDTWDTVLTGISVTDIKINPHDPDIIFVGLGTSNFTRPGIIKSVDKGQNWYWSNKNISFIDGAAIAKLAIHPISPDTMYAVKTGLFPGYIYKSTDGGTSWTQLDSPIVQAGHICAINPKYPNIIYYAGTQLYKSIDSGQSWKLKFDCEGSGITGFAIHPVNCDTLYLSKQRDGIYMSPDGGESWLKKDSSITNYYFQNLIFDDFHPETLFSATAGGIYRSTNSGNLWVLLDSGLEGIIPYNVYIDPYNQNLYTCKYHLGGIFRLSYHPSNIKDKHDIIPSELCLYQNYPNPFNLTTNINFYIPEDKYIRITLYNLKGSFQSTITEGFFSKGYHKYIFKANDIPSGIYIYQIIDDCSSKTQKCLLIK